MIAVIYAVDKACVASSMSNASHHQQNDCFCYRSQKCSQANSSWQLQRFPNVCIDSSGWQFRGDKFEVTKLLNKRKVVNKIRQSVE